MARAANQPRINSLPFSRHRRRSRAAPVSLPSGLQQALHRAMDGDSSRGALCGIDCVLFHRTGAAASSRHELQYANQLSYRCHRSPSRFQQSACCRNRASRHRLQRAQSARPGTPPNPTAKRPDVRLFASLSGTRQQASRTDEPTDGSARYVESSPERRV